VSRTPVLGEALRTKFAKREVIRFEKVSFDSRDSRRRGPPLSRSPRAAANVCRIILQITIEQHDHLSARSHDAGVHRCALAAVRSNSSTRTSGRRSMRESV
jgi:hypothetical protein